jgi:hypothetical protein
VRHQFVKESLAFRENSRVRHLDIIGIISLRTLLRFDALETMVAFGLVCHQLVEFGLPVALSFFLRYDELPVGWKVVFRKGR